MKTGSRFMKIIFWAIVPFLILSCGSDSKKDNSANGFFKRAETAVASAYSEINAANFVDPTCNNSGEPTSSAIGSIAYAREKAFCGLNQNSQSPDTVQGSFFLVSKVLCAVEKQISFEYAATPTNHNAISFAENDDCFAPNGFDSDGNGNVNGTVLVSLQDVALSGTGSLYDYFIGLQLGVSVYDNSAVPAVQFYLKDSGGILAARVYQQLNQNIFEFVINSNTETFDYEMRNYANPNFRHERLSAQGSVSLSSGSFSRVNSASYIFADGDAGSTSRSVIMSFNNGVEQYDHHVNTGRAPGYSQIAAIPHNPDFYTWSGRSILDTNPLTAPLLNLGVFNMNF